MAWINTISEKYYVFEGTPTHTPTKKIANILDIDTHTHKLKSPIYQTDAQHTNTTNILNPPKTQNEKNI